VVVVVVAAVLRQLPRSHLYKILQKIVHIILIFPLFTINFVKKTFFVEVFTFCYLFSSKTNCNINRRQSMLG